MQRINLSIEKGRDCRNRRCIRRREKHAVTYPGAFGYTYLRLCNIQRNKPEYIKRKKQAGIRNRIFGFVFQFYHLLPDFTALENVLLPVFIGGGFSKRKAENKDYTSRAISLLERVGLGDRLTHKPSQLSGGERQRVAIVRALVNNPELLLCDEPTGNLDTKTGHEIRELIWDLNKTLNQTVVIVTHDEEIAKHAGRVVRIVDGCILE